jgi:SWI/SNF-related matrix-associated actin-dependent regulator of chromatin subfamily A-like protein 1
MNAQEMLLIVRKFVSYGAPDAYDGQGPNKFDWNFFEMMSHTDELNAEQVHRCAERLRKYRNTQMPRAFSECGLTMPEDWETMMKTLESQVADTADLVTFEEIQITNWSKKYNKNFTNNRLVVQWSGRRSKLYLDLKNSIGFPEFQYQPDEWDEENNTYKKRGMHFKIDRDVILKGAGIMAKHGLKVADLVLHANTIDSTSQSKKKVGYSVRVEDDSVLLFIPYNEVRTREIIKATNGKKWEGETKEWRVAMVETLHLMKRLGDDHELTKQMKGMTEITEANKDRAERISISGAASLDDKELVEDMETRLAKEFPAGYKLYPFQYAGVRFAEIAKGKAIIGDDMGIGKTIQAIAYCALHQDHWPVLVVCPANVKYNWLKELRTWLPNRTSEAVKNGKDDITDADFTVINYDLMSKKQGELEDIGFNTIIMDECHYLKTSDTKRTIATVALAKECKSILALSGTAITNRPIELFNTLNMVRPAEYSNFFSYAIQYCGAVNNGYGWDFKGASNIDELHSKLRDVMIRRLKKEVLEELPDKIRQFVPVTPKPKEMTEYKRQAARWLREYESHKANNSMPAGFVLNMLTDLRHRCGLLKVSATLNWVAEYRDITDNKPILIFTHHRDVGNALVEGLSDDKRFTGSNWGRIDGTVKAETRQQLVESFQAGELDGLVCATLAAKEGLTLTAADTVVFIEREWVPGWEEQAEDRVNRIGQDSDTVWATYLSVAGTIDERFDRIVEQKRETVSAILDGGDITERKGLAVALLQAMIDAGDLPADMLEYVGVAKSHFEEEEE